MKSQWFLKSLVFLYLLANGSSYRYAPFDDESPLDFTIVDVSIYLWTLPSSLLTSLGIDNISMACQVFLESTLNVHPTIITDLKVAIVSQNLDGRGGIEALQNSTYFVLEVHMQILVRYQLAGNYPDLKDMDTRIRTLFTKDWEELYALLKLLDPSYFASLHSLEVKPRILGPTEEPITVSSGNPKKLESNGLSTSIVVILLVVGIGIVLSLTTLAPLCCMKSNTRYVQEIHEWSGRSRGRVDRLAFSHLSFLPQADTITYPKSNDVNI
jgi:hypothetical protein